MTKRVVYGATCTWWDTIDKVGRTKSGLPGCPICAGVLFEMKDEDEWWRLVYQFEADGYPGYSDRIQWARGKCFKLIAPEGATERISYEYEKAHNET